MRGVSRRFVAIRRSRPNHGRLGLVDSATRDETPGVTTDATPKVRVARVPVNSKGVPSSGFVSIVRSDAMGVTGVETGVRSQRILDALDRRLAEDGHVRDGLDDVQAAAAIDRERRVALDVRNEVDVVVAAAQLHLDAAYEQ